VNDSVLNSKRTLAMEIDYDRGWKRFIGRIYRFLTEDFEPEWRKGMDTTKIKWWI